MPAATNSRYLSRANFFFTKVAQYRIDVHYSGFLQSQVTTMAAVSVVFRLAHDLRPDRIKMNVSNQLAQIRLGLAKNRLVTPAKDAQPFGNSGYSTACNQLRLDA